MPNFVFGSFKEQYDYNLADRLHYSCGYRLRDIGNSVGQTRIFETIWFYSQKSGNGFFDYKLTYIGSETSIVTRDHLRFTKSNFTDDGNNVVTFCVLVPHNLDLKEGQRVSVVHVDDILLLVEAIDE